LHGKCRHTVVRQHITIERVQARIVEVGRQHAFAQFGPDPRARTERQQSNRFATVAQSQHEQSRAPVSATVGVAHHRPGAVIYLAFLAGLSLDDDTRLGRYSSAQLAYIALDALVAAREPMVVHQILPDPHGVAPAIQLQGNDLGIWLAGAHRARNFWR
jgi:hypothetical protein